MALVLGALPSTGFSEPLVAQITYPTNGSTNVDLSQPVQWTTVIDAEAYYLYVGSTIGAKDLVDTGEIAATSYLPEGFPPNQTVFARLWTKRAGFWYPSDSSFTTSATTVSVIATFTSPINGANDVDTLQPIQWTTVLNSQAYYLYVGSTLGAKDLVDSGEIQSISYLPAGLPAVQTVYARLWTKVGGFWRSSDSIFRTSATAIPVIATFTSPVSGAAAVDTTLAMQWATVPNAQAYYLYVGATLGAKDLVDTGEIQATSYVAASLAGGQAVFARLWTKAGGIWRSSDINFTTADAIATLTYPANGATEIDQVQPATWTSVANVQAYYLYVGSTLGAKDYVDSAELSSTSFRMKKLPVGPTIYARLWTKTGGTWRSSDSTFTAARIAPAFVYPTRGSVAVVLTRAFQWTPIVDAAGYRLVVSSTPGDTNLVDTGTIQQTTYSVPSLPADRVLYGRIYSLVHGSWRFGDTVFTLMPAGQAAEPSYPLDGVTNADTGQPFQWNAVDIADGYRLELGTQPGGHDLHDSGLIRATRRFVPDLETGVTIYARLSTSIGGQWLARDFTFIAVANTIATTTRVASAWWATHVVSAMAPLSGSPVHGTPQIGAELSDFINASGELEPYCSDYSLELQSMLAQMNIGAKVEILNIAFNPNGYDAHTLVEMATDDTGRRMLLDPMFDLSVKRTADGESATAEEVSTATRGGRWEDMSYVFNQTSDDEWVRQYYLDYPLLFLNVYHSDRLAVNGVGEPVLPYMTSEVFPSSGDRSLYVVGCSGTTSAEISADGKVTVVDCSGVDGLSHAFWADSINATASTPSSLTLYRPRRFVF